MLQGKELQNHLQEMLSHFAVRIALGKTSVVVRQEGVTKGAIVDHIIKHYNSRGGADFVLCLGDDTADEDMFKVISAYHRDAQYRIVANSQTVQVVDTHAPSARTPTSVFLPPRPRLPRRLRPQPARFRARDRDLTELTRPSIAAGSQGLHVHRRAPAVDCGVLPLQARGGAGPFREAPPRTKWTRRVPHPVLIGHAASPQTRSLQHVSSWRCCLCAHRSPFRACVASQHT